MSSARGRALSEQRRHPIHRAKKPWTNTKRPASNQPQNKRGETLVYITPSSKGGMLHCLYSLCPQANAQPSLRRSTVWQPPAETCVYVTPSSKSGMLHCPWTFCNCAAITSEKHCMSNTCRNHMRSLSTDRWKGSFHCSEPHSRVALTMVDADVSNDV